MKPTALQTLPAPTIARPGDRRDASRPTQKAYKRAQELGWAEERAVEALWALLKEGLALVDDQGPGGQRLYWFPCLAADAGGAAAGDTGQ